MSEWHMRSLKKAAMREKVSETRGEQGMTLWQHGFGTVCLIYSDSVEWFMAPPHNIRSRECPSVVPKTVAARPQ